MINPLIAIFTYSDLKASLGEVGIVVSAFFVASIISKIPTAFILRGDRILQALLFGILSNTVALFGYALIPNIQVMYLVRILHGISLAVSIITMLTVSASLTASESEMVVAVERYSAATAVGLMFGPAIGTVLVSLVGLRITFLAAALLSIPSSILGYLFFRMTSGIWVGATITKFSLHDLFYMLRSRLLILSYLVYLIFAYVYGVVVSYEPIEAKITYAMSDSEITGLFFGYFGLTLVTRVLLGRLLPRYSFSKLIAAGLIIPALGLILTGIGLYRLAFALGFVIIGVGHGLIFPLTAILVAKSVPLTHRIIANSVYLTAFDLGNVFAPLISSGTSVVLGVGLSLSMTALAPLLGLTLVPLLRREVLE
jgi:MFS family permease